MLDGCGTHEGEAIMKRGQWSDLGLTALHTAAWLVRWRGDGGERKAEGCWRAICCPRAMVHACVYIRGERVVWSAGRAGLERFGHERHDGACTYV